MSLSLAIALTKGFLKDMLIDNGNGANQTHLFAEMGEADFRFLTKLGHAVDVQSLLNGGQNVVFRFRN